MIRRPPRRSAAVLALAAGAAALAAAPLASGATDNQIPGPPSATGAWTARIVYPVPARMAPSATARVRMGLMHYTAFSRRPQRLLVTAEATDASGHGWVRVQLPVRPNGSQAWVPTAAVKLSRTDLHIKVRLGAKRVEVWRGPHRISSYPAAVGTGSTPTPVGTFAMQDPVPSAPAQRSYLGPYILTLTAHSTVLRSFMGGDGLVAIHGTNAPNLLGQAVSHGCIRVSNAAVRALYRIVEPGTPVQITRA
jgi:lipoprotein-anchoring transpeptidase ErfK/SrfK